ncbi:MAG: helix-turn-helix domain-containing protein [Candidatus Norongarragalinales archaeon]
MNKNQPPVFGTNAKLVIEDKALDSRIIPEKTLKVFSGDRLRILESLSQKPKYPAEVAKELKMHLQTAYYHFNLLEKAGVIARGATEEKRGALAKKFSFDADALSVVINESWKPYAGKKKKPPSFFEGFVKNGLLDAKIIVGSPDPHGPHRSRGSELCAMELSALLGAYASFEYPLYYLDTEARESVLRQNLFLLGGPKVNTVLEKANRHMPVYFDEKFGVVSKVSGRNYSENVGIIESFESPFAENKKIFAIAGSDHHATRVGILAVLKKRKQLEGGNNFDAGVFAKVAQGFDEDGDGIVDEVEILE